MIGAFVYDFVRRSWNVDIGFTIGQSKFEREGERKNRIGARWINGTFTTKKRTRNKGTNERKSFQDTYLFLSDADIIPIVYCSVNSQCSYGAQDNPSGFMSVERCSRKMNWEIRVSQVLQHRQVPEKYRLIDCIKQRREGNKEIRSHTWYTVPPPLRLRMNGIWSSLWRNAPKLTSFQGFWFRPITTQGSSRYNNSRGSFGALCLNNLDVSH